MKTLLTVAVVAVLAIVIVEISQSADAQRGCEAGKKPALNTTAVTCDTKKNGTIAEQIKHKQENNKCAKSCKNCYKKEDLAPRGGCLVGGKCTCLAKQKAATTTTVAPAETTNAAPTDAPTEDPGSE